MKTKSKKFYFREFLNLDTCRGGIASLRIGEGSVEISDCNKTISLEFYISEDSSEGDLINTEHKIDTLHRGITEYRKHLKSKMKRIRKENASEE